MSARELVEFMEKYPDFDFEEFLRLEKKREEYLNSKLGQDHLLIGTWIQKLSDAGKVYRRGYRIKLSIHMINNLLRRMREEQSAEIAKMLLRIKFDRIKQMNVEFETIDHFEKIEFVEV